MIVCKLIEIARINSYVNVVINIGFNAKANVYANTSASISNVIGNSVSFTINSNSTKIITPRQSGSAKHYKEVAK